jgi:Mycobacterial 4 TMS phage holin, superfamily IV/Type I phosphodiesterase / nucleotide pyrophosphatase
LINALVWPVFAYFALPLAVLTLGAAAIVLNGAAVAVVAYLIPGVEVRDLWTAIAVALVLTLVNAGLTALLTVDDEDVYYRQVIRRAARRVRPDGVNDVPGVLFVQIDGLGLAVLRRALRDGNAPTLARWLASGSHRLLKWETGWSSQTGASQCGILHGSTYDIPAFRWLEKESGARLVSNHPRSAAEIERRHSDGRGLLYADGAGRGNLYTGDAGQNILTMSVAGRKRGRVGQGYYAYFAVPYNAMRTFVGFVAEIVRELAQASRQRRNDVRPRVGRGGLYPFLRAFATVITRDVTTQTLIGDLYTGRSVIYADFVGYDEVAHHSGPERYDALDTLLRLDRDIGRLERAAANAPRPYRFVVLSDHGQSQGTTFEDRYGCSLGELVQAAMHGQVSEIGAARVAGEESWGYAQAAAADVASENGRVGRVLQRALRDKRDSGDGPAALAGDRAPVQTAERREAERRDNDTAVATAPGEAVVLASGNLGLVYLTEWTERVSLETIGQRYPDLIPALTSHPGIGFVLVRSDELGPVVIGRDGLQALQTQVVHGVDPLQPFGASARWQVLQTDSYPHCADIMVNSMWDPQTGEVAAFEHLVGSHGGLGGEQTHPFVLYPADLPAPAGPIRGADELHKVLRGWLAFLGHDAYAGHSPDSGALETPPAAVPMPAPPSGDC